MCQKAAKQSNSPFCGKTCTELAEKQSPMMLEVPAGHITFNSGE